MPPLKVKVFTPAKNIALYTIVSILTTFSYYQGRWDRIFLTKEGEFQVKYGTPDDNPDLPEIVDDAIEIAQLELPPYIYNTKDISVDFLKYKRFNLRLWL